MIVDVAEADEDPRVISNMVFIVPAHRPVVSSHAALAEPAPPVLQERIVIELPEVEVIVCVKFILLTLSEPILLTEKNDSYVVVQTFCELVNVREVPGADALGPSARVILSSFPE